MRVVIDEDIPSELTPLFRGPDLEVQHVEEIGLKGTKNSDLLKALSGACDIFVTGDTNLGHSRTSASTISRSFSCIPTGWSSIRSNP